ncbi:MAG: helix-turn-helix transcriptional regulator [Ignavibacteria bacterium]|nr:helix-turn-helix transcriptional regulator [Ignavibacteria bacterium]
MKRRLELGLYQKDVAQTLGVDESTVTNWEKHRTDPTLRAIPKTIEFLGYAPEFDSKGLLGERIKRYRRMQGINQETLAKQLGVDPATLGRWERGEASLGRSSEKGLLSFSEAWMDYENPVKDSRGS